ncbi:caspase family protein [Prosthecomicrobium hirschii]|uniref:caspase family protein n=1 Tax=Prosthecodimorpha hirschii TaxID=665126 RepID=UPI00221E5A2E|nr:caspase family protein [Prosthecomicrobium hirschii]MCW1838746.1 caspase family protein [Prosthecomicrobium hirschii]
MRRLLFAALAVVFFANPAMAGKRVALVIGNSAYKSAPLSNPERDVDAMAKAFRAAGFDTVQVHKNLTREGMSRALDAFEAASDGAEISAIYFSGHGLEINGTNYLLPVDAKVATAREVKFEAIPLDDLVQASHGATRLRLILLDACRDNPFVAQSRGASGKGLARVEASQADTLVAYATAAGATATDGDGKMSPFAAALAEHLFAPDLDVRIALGRARDAVSKATEGRQRPYQVGSLGGDVVALKKKNDSTEDNLLNSTTIEKKPWNLPEIPPYVLPVGFERVQLFEEGIAGVSQNRVSHGRVMWRTVRERPGAGKPIVTMIKAQIEVPDRGLTLSLSVRPNTDKSFPASHLIELRFEVPRDFDNKGVSNAPGLILKQLDTVAGDPLVGAAARIKPNYFWVALSAPEAERQRNLGLLKDRSWIDIPILFDNGRRAILTIEKAGAGDRVVGEALTAWTQGLQ